MRRTTGIDDGCSVLLILQFFPFFFFFPARSLVLVLLSPAFFFVFLSPAHVDLTFSSAHCEPTAERPEWPGIKGSPVNAARRRRTRHDPALIPRPPSIRHRAPFFALCNFPACKTSATGHSPPSRLNVSSYRLIPRASVVDYSSLVELFSYVEA